MVNGMTKIYTWSLITRLFHVLLVVAVGLVYIFSEVENLLSYHVAFGYFIGLLFLFRIIWGFMDVKYSKFKDFNFNLKELFEYLTNIFGTKKDYTGHNPASSWAIITMIILALFSVISGTIVYGTQEGMGILASLNNTMFKDMEFFEEVHEIFANAFIAVVFIHIAGVVVDRVIHKSKAVESMITGYKEADGKSLTLTAFQKLFSAVWIGLSIFLLVYLLLNPSNILLADSNKKINYKSEHQLFYDECISCHTLYPPFLLPKKSWVKMMDNLENHFGDDASLENEDKESIKSFLLQNSAENSTKESAFKIDKSIKNGDIIAITETPYWKKPHKDIDKKIFENKKVGKISNCKACHKNIEEGLLNDRGIEMLSIGYFNDKLVTFDRDFKKLQSHTEVEIRVEL